MKDSLGRDLYVGAYVLYASPKGHVVAEIVDTEKDKVTLSKTDGSKSNVKFVPAKFFLLRDVTAATN